MMTKRLKDLGLGDSVWLVNTDYSIIEADCVVIEDNGEDYVIEVRYDERYIDRVVLDSESMRVDDGHICLRNNAKGVYDEYLYIFSDYRDMLRWCLSMLSEQSIYVSGLIKEVVDRIGGLDD